MFLKKRTPIIYSAPESHIHLAICYPSSISPKNKNLEASQPQKQIQIHTLFSIVQDGHCLLLYVTWDRLSCNPEYNTVRGQKNGWMDGFKLFGFRSETQTK